MAGSGKLAEMTGPLTVAQVRERAAKWVRTKKVQLKLRITEVGDKSYSTEESGSGNIYGAGLINIGLATDSQHPQHLAVHSFRRHEGGITWSSVGSLGSKYFGDHF
jgi:hypothetical protein